MKHVLLVGNPNCGKTTIFNALTGDNQRVGNWPGVTVEKKTGLIKGHEQTLHLTDLPGVYALGSEKQHASQDALITTREVAHGHASLIINVIDACQLERQLYLTSQLLELGLPLIVALNMTDLAAARGIQIDTAALSRALQCPVVTLQAHRAVGLASLHEAMHNKVPFSRAIKLTLPVITMQELASLEQQILLKSSTSNMAHFLACRVLEGDDLLVDTPLKRRQKSANISESDDIIMADARYLAIHTIVIAVQKKSSDSSESFTARLDKIVLHRWFALPIFFAVMYAMFFCAITIGGALQSFFDIITNTIFVDGTQALLIKLHAPQWLGVLCADGIGKGINTTLTFIPVLACMYFFLAMLDASGYMARAAFVIDRIMRTLGLPGKSFVPMIVGFGCNVPAIMAARTLDSEQERLLTVLMSPFMSCSARLAIYTVFVAAFFQHNAQNIVFSLYCIGILIAVLTGYLLRKTLFKGQASPLFLELPIYHRPTLHRLYKETSFRLRYFIIRAGKFIIPACVILGMLNSCTIANAEHDTLLSWIGKFLTPLLAPMGIENDNWPATVGLLAGTLAKEVVIGSLNTLYSQIGQLTIDNALTFNFWQSMQDAFMSIPQYFSNSQSTTIQPVYGVMAQYFHGAIGAYAYLLFILLYIPCISTMAAIRQETNKRFMWFSIIWSLTVAYCVAISYYQLATINLHPQKTWLIVIAVLAFLTLVILVFNAIAKRKRTVHAITTQ